MKIAIITLLAFTLCSQTLAQNEISLLHSKYLWRSPNPGTKIEFSPSSLTVSSTSSSTGIYNLLPINISSKKYNLLVVKMKTSKDGIGEVSWASENLRFHPLQSYPFYLRKPGQWYTYYLNLSSYHRGSAPINHLLFFPFQGPGTAEIKEIKFIKGTLGEKALAAWQEFWGPRGREPDGFNFLVIRSPRLFGGPFLRYLNYFLLIVLAITFLLKPYLDLRRPFLILLLTFWLFLELSSWVNNWIAFRRDLIFLGKTLEEKRTLINPKDYYPFLKFADQHLPPSSSFEVDTKLPYGKAKAAYYLYPRSLTANAPYLLIFDQEINRNYLKNFYLWKTFRKGAYLLKAKKI
jgi:hypothetical protein